MLKEHRLSPGFRSDDVHSLAPFDHFPHGFDDITGILVAQPTVQRKRYRLLVVAVGFGAALLIITEARIIRKSVDGQVMHVHSYVLGVQRIVHESPVRSESL